MKGPGGTGNRNCPSGSSKTFLKAGLFSCLLHLFLLLLLGTGPGTGLPQTGPKVYRVALHPVVPRENPVQKTGPVKRTRHPLPGPLPFDAPPEAPVSPPVEIPVPEVEEKITADLKSPEEPAVRKEELVPVSLPAAVSARPPEEPDPHRLAPPILEAVPALSLETGPEIRDPPVPALPGGFAGRETLAAAAPGEDPGSRKGGLARPEPGPGPGPGSGIGAGKEGDTGTGLRAGGKGAHGRDDVRGDGMLPAWNGTGRPAGSGTGGSRTDAEPGAGGPGTMALGPGSSGSGGSGSADPSKDTGKGGPVVVFGFGRGGAAPPSPRHAENPNPVYPPEARKKGYHGRVLLRVEVLSSGLVGQVEIKRSSGHGVLDQSALRAVKRWKFTPARQEGVPVAFWVNIPITFELL